MAPTAAAEKRAAAKGNAAAPRGGRPAKGKSAAKGKAAKAKAGGKASPKGRRTPKVTEEVEADSGAVVEAKQLKTLRGSAGLRAKVLADVGSDIKGAIGQHRERFEQAEAVIAKEQAAVEQNANLLATAQTEYDSARARVEADIEEECRAAAAFREAGLSLENLGAHAAETRTKLAMAQRRFAQLEVLVVNRKKIEELEAKRKEASEAAQAAKQALLDQRAKEKEALEATKRQLQLQRQEQKQAKADAQSAKRARIEEVAQAHDGEDIE